MLKLTRFILVIVILAVAFASCNKASDNADYEYLSTQNVAITSFRLQSNSNVLNNLDSVFFSIDMVNAQVFNADSLPYGTDISSLGVTIGVGSVSKVLVYTPVDNDGEIDFKEINYLENKDAKVDFSRGAVKVKIVSADGEYSREYSVKVNVHELVPDSLYWSELACANLPSLFSRPVAQKSVRFGDKAYCLSSDGAEYCMAVSTSVFDNQWVKERVVFLENVDVRSLSATEDALYILTTTGALLSSTDGLSWSETSQNWHSIIAAYENEIIGVRAVGSGYEFVSFPQRVGGVAPSDFPISGVSSSASLSSKWSERSQVVILGGRMADDALTGATWAFDGERWAKISEGMIEGENYALASFAICETDTVSWNAVERNVLIAMGGNGAFGVNNSVFVSRDFGLTWKRGSSLLQLPEYMQVVTDCDLLVFDHLITSSAGVETTAWRGCALKMPRVSVQSRIAQLPDEWECPYIYRFGGADETGTLSPFVWRGVVNHFTFRPLE